jgi:ubiquinone/menaquinone biosynthesis C-methylase UbiE
VIVEIGAGTGLFSAKFAEISPESHVFACDTECAMLEWMRDQRPEVSEGRITRVLSGETFVPLPDAVASLVVMINVHHELAMPETIYAEVARLLAPGGQALVVDWKPVDTPKGPPREIRATARQLAEALTTAGLDDVASHDLLPWHSLLTARKR